MSIQIRQSKGQPTGGQFAAAHRPDAAVELAPAPTVEIRHNGRPWLRGTWADGSDTATGGKFTGHDIHTGEAVSTYLAGTNANVPGRTLIDLTD